MFVTPEMVNRLHLIGGGAAKVLLAILWYYNDKQNAAWPSAETLAAVTGLKRKAVFSGLRQLRESGLIERKRRYQQSNIYTIPDHVLNPKGRIDVPKKGMSIDVPKKGTLGTDRSGTSDVPKKGTNIGSKKGTIIVPKKGTLTNAVNQSNELIPPSAPRAGGTLAARAECVPAGGNAQLAITAANFSTEWKYMWIAEHGGQLAPEAPQTDYEHVASLLYDIAEHGKFLSARDLRKYVRTRTSLQDMGRDLEKALRTLRESREKETTAP